MTRPAAPEYSIKLAQYDRLRQIVAGDDWHSHLGAGVRLSPLADETPAQHCWPGDVSTESSEDGVNALVSITWEAVVQVGDDSTDAELVRADMRAALVSLCPMGTTKETASTVSMRDAGSNYATVTVTVQTPIIIEGRFDG